MALKNTDNPWWRIQEAKEKKITILDLSDYGFSQIPDEAFELAHLEVLNLSGNKITKLPEEILQFQVLQSLNLRHNEIIEIPKEILQLPLTELNIANCGLTQIPNEIFELTLLTCLILGTSSGAGIEITANRNRINKLPSKIKNLKNLKKLDLTCIELNELP